MASFYDITIGQQVEFQRVLAKAGFTDADIARIIKEPGLAPAMYAAIQPQIIDAGDPPAWWRTPEQQLERAYQLWPDAVLPEPLTHFVPQTKTEVLLLHVPDTFDALWDKVVTPMGYTKHRSAVFRSGKQNLRLAPNKVEFTQPVWLAFDPEHGRGEAAEDFWGQADIAASEVLSALIQFPEWQLSWFDGASAPNLSGYQLKYDGDWSHAPSLSLVDGRQLELGCGWAVLRFDSWSSPSVRECSN